MPVFTGCALAGVGIGLWLQVFETASVWPLAAALILPLAWWIAGTGMLITLTALTITSLQCHWYQDALLPEPLIQSDILLRGVIADFPRAEADSVVFSFRPVSVDAGSWFPEYLLLRIYTTDLQPQAGELWELLVRLKRPAGTINWDGFDRESWALWNRVHANGYVRNSLLNRRLQARGPDSTTLRWRDTVRQRIDTALAGQPMSPLVQGITIAARQAIDTQTWAILRDSGTSHLVAISGLHIGLVAAFLWYPGRFAGGILNSLGWLTDPLLPARMLAFGGAIAYGALAGYPTPTLRACLMISAILLLDWRHRFYPSGIGVLSTALLLILMADPLALLSPGFWLSFIAVALLYTCLIRTFDPPTTGPPKADRLETVKRFVAANLRTQFVLGIGLALPSLVFFSQVSVVSLVANLLAIPLFTFYILPLALIGAGLVTVQLSAGAWLLSWAASGLDWLIAVMRILAKFPGATWRPVNLDGITLLLILTASAITLVRRPLPGKMAGLALLVLLLSRDSPAVSGLLRLQVLDVGQGLAVLVQTRNHSLLYDTGARWRGGDSGQIVIVPALQANAIRSLDMLIVSHDDADHSGGVGSVLQAVRAQRILAPAPGYHGIDQAADCQAGAEWEWDKVKFRIVHPARRAAWSDNNASCVLLVVAANQKILLPGDIEAEAELEIVKDPELQEISLVLAPHHGSRTSSTQPFVNAVAAKYVIFSAGYANRWGFPKPDIVQRWVDSGTCVLSTSTSGALRFSVADDGTLAIAAAARASWTRPWVIRNAHAADCTNTINSRLAGV